MPDPIIVPTTIARLMILPSRLDGGGGGGGGGAASSHAAGVAPTRAWQSAPAA